MNAACDGDGNDDFVCHGLVFRVHTVTRGKK
jgi:hypothetical protein